MKTIFEKITLTALFFVVTFDLPSVASTQDECEFFNRIIESGLNQNNPFAAVAGLTLPNADKCNVSVNRDNKWNNFECSWNEENEAKIEKMQEEKEEIFMIWSDHEGGTDAWNEEKSFIDKAN